ncbi:winged helix-turn-helix transcriptional regulator, partial [Leyella stercorea]|uniref:winged helix-turn-helix transcriptional regulator n=1 Tax=Leyella stercorea TaxID=363265 RepID=UPI00266C9666
TEGRSTGVPTIQAKLAENGSPRAIFETTDDRLTFLVTIPIHEGCSDSSVTKSESSGTSLSSSEESIETVGFGSEKSTGSSEKTSNSSEKTSNSSEKILELIKQNPKISAAGIAMEIGISSRGVEKQIKKLREAGIIKRNGADKGGYWEIVNLGND